MGKGVTRTGSKQFEGCLSLTDKLASKCQLGNVLFISMLRNLKVLLGQGQVLSTSKWTEYPAREPLLMAIMMSLQATLWRSVIIPEMIMC